MNVTMLRSRLFCILRPRRCISYLSTEFNNLANQAPPKLPGGEHKAKNLEIFVKEENRQLDLLDLLLKLRKQKESTAVPLFPGILVRQILDSTSPQELVAVLSSPLQYGLFIDQFSGCYLMDQLLHSGHGPEAAQIAALLAERDLCNSELVAALSLQSFYAFVKHYISTPAEPKPDKVAPAKPEIEKVRVKFLRNYVEEDPSNNTEEKLLGRALIKLCASGSGSIKELLQNFELLGLALSGQLPELEKLLAQNQSVFHKEVLQLCLSITEKSESPVEALKQALSSCSRNEAISQLLDASVKDCVQRHEPQLIAEHVKRYEQWTLDYDKAVNQQLEIQDFQARVENIKTIMDDLQEKRQNLWYFENKDDHDIDIYKKKVYYPKRWFGKKKKPKAVDTFYVPPTITHNS